MEGEGCSVFMIVLSCMALVFDGGRRLLPETARPGRFDIRRKRVVRQKAIVCSAGTALVIVPYLFHKTSRIKHAETH